MSDAWRWAVSVGLVNDMPLLDLCYEEDVSAQVDMNLVMTANGRFVEIQGSGEETTFDQSQLHGMLELGRTGLDKLFEQQRLAISGS